MHEDEIGAFPGGDAADVALAAEKARAVSCTDLDRLRRGEARFDEQLDLPLIAEPGQHAAGTGRIRPSEQQPSTTAVTTQTARGRRAMARPVLAHMPLAVGSAEPYRGRSGQKIHRPTITSSAGSNVIMATRPTAIPIAATGPRPEMSAESAASRQSMPAITVAPLAMMAGPARRSATAMASCRSECLRSSSRYRAMSSNA